MTRRPLLILGTRTMAVEVADLVADGGEYDVVGFVENMERARCSERLEGLPILWVEELTGLGSTHWAVCALGSTLRENYTAHVEALGIPFATIIHPTARVSRNSSVGAGSILNAGVIIATHTIVGKHTILNRGTLVGHHTVIGDHVSIMPGASVAGSCTIGSGCYIGMGALILDHLAVGSGSVVGAGAVVTRNVPEAAEVVGMPARITKTNIPRR